MRLPHTRLRRSHLSLSPCSLLSSSRVSAPVDLEEERECQESKAWEELDKGKEKATTVLQLLKKLDRPDQFSLYYCGGLKLLSHAISDCTGQTLFRLNNGFSILQTNDTVSG
uniref:Uncharacterized protein n=1 Tax=Hucho hucho TaxID=62062 RepID=A0A4W5QL86_9TELE